ncbi:phytoene desaturase family protein [Lihuaxuella thermophila]|nr:FAD-dependent oxidoreductase [Lihuaxuella thermophila]
MKRLFEEDHKWDAVIVGGGLAGLTAATFLGRSGKSVLLCEKADRMGGRAQTQDKNGCLFNLGPHALYKKGAGMKILSELGIEPQGGTPQINGKLVYEGTIHPMPLSPASVFTSKLFAWQEKKELGSFLQRLYKTDYTQLYGISLEEWIGEQIQYEKVKKFFLTLCRLATYTNEPELVSAGIVIRQLQMASDGVLYLHGGWQTLIQSLQEKAIQAGVRICSGAKVAEIRGAYPEMVVRLADDIKIRTKYVISTASPAETFQMVEEADKTGLAALKEELIPIEGACLDLALRRLPRPELSFALHLEQPYYYSNHSRVARLTENPDHVVIHLYKYCSSREEADANQPKRELEEFFNLIQPGWQQELITMRYLPRIRASHGLITPLRAGRLDQESTIVPGIPGLFLAGDWLGKDGLLADAAISSAKRAAAQLIQHEWKEGELHRDHTDILSNL